MLKARLVVTLAIAGCGQVTSEPPAAQAPAASPPSPPVAAARTRPPAPMREPIAPWSLTASNGSGLRLISVDAKAVIEGPLAFTELHLSFYNAEDRIREGTFAITLPSRATVSRFAMVEPDRIKEAEVVPKALARRAYDDALHRGIDPAILEKAAGNQFTARVFPIPPHAVKDLVISYSQELVAAGYVLPLTGLPMIDDVSVALDAVRPDGSHQTQAMHEKAWQPDRDFIANVDTPDAIATGDLVAGTFDVAPPGGATEDRPTALAILVDTSASRAPGFRRYLDRVRKLVNGLAERYDRLSVEVIAFDQESRAMYAGPARDFGDAQVAAFVERRAEGASDLALAAASVTSPRIAIITDGVVTAGREGAELAKAFHAERIDVILAGGIRDEHVATLLARAGARPGDVFDLDDRIEPIASGLGEAVQVDVPIAVPGATWFHPHTVASLRPGTQVMVFARLATPEHAFAVTIGGTPHSAAVSAATPALLERAAARVEIDELEIALASTTGEAASAKLRKEIETRSVAARVASTQAAMLILDSDDDYARYGIDRRSLADILVVGAHGLEQLHRTFVASKDHARGARLALTREEALAYARRGGQGTGYGVGGGHGSMRGRVAAVPTVSIGMPSAMGSLDKSFIRRYIHRQIEKITYCYERELLARPHLHGTIQTKFTIGANGLVLEAEASGFDDKVATCIAGVIKAIEFPAAIGGGLIVVTYPFTFRTPETPDDDADVEQAVSAAPAAPHAPVPAATTDRRQPATRGRQPAAPTADHPPAAPTAGRQPVTPSPAIATGSPLPATPPGAMSPTPSPAEPAPAFAVHSPAPDVTPPPAQDGPTFGPASSALTGKLARVMSAIARRDASGALALAKTWRDDQPTDVLAIVGLGEAFEATGDRASAVRAYGSIIDLYPSQADFRRFAGERLERLGPLGRVLAIDTYRRAVADRPDQVTGHRLLAYALLRGGDLAGAFAAILAGVDQHAIAGRYAGAELVFARDAGMIAAAYLAHGGNRERIEHALSKRKLELVTEPSTRFLLYWETDANDVDLHVRDAAGGHAWYSHKALESGGALYADITTGFGPECFEIKGPATAGPYTLGVHYYAQGPMGYGMGLLQIERFDGKAFAFDDRPYVIMTNQAAVSLGKTP